MTETIEPLTTEPRDERDDEASPEPAATSPRRAPRWHTPALVAGLVAVAGGIPLAVALGVLRHPRWYPLLDLAQTELRVRDVGSSNPPLVGLAGRFYAFDQQGSHLGPLSFWSLWPFYKLLGSTAWALQAASACLSLAAMAVATWIAHRRGGARAALAVALALAVLARTYGAGWLTEAWNPYMPMLWWVVFLLAVWSVLCDDLPLLPVAVFAGSFCMQTHIPYLGLVGALGGLTALAVVWKLVVASKAEGRSPRSVLAWGLASLVLLAVLWTPPVIAQVVNEPGNMSVVRASLSDGDEEPVGVRRAVEAWTSNLDVRLLVETSLSAHDDKAPAPSGVSAAGLVALAVWLAAAATAWWRRQRPGYAQLARLHLVVGAALLLGLVSTSRVLGFLWYYLVLWSLGTTTLLVVAVAWTATLLWRDHLEGRDPDGDASRTRPWAVGGTVVLGALLVVTAAAFTYDATDTQVPAADESRTLRQVAPQVVEALEAGEAPGGGRDGRYLVRWEDTLSIGSQGFGLLLELERQGFDVGVPAPYKTGAVAHRERQLDDSTASVNYVNGEAAIDRWEALPGAVRVASHDPRSPAERDRFDRLHDEVVRDLRREGLDELVPGVEANLFVVAVDERVPTRLADKLRQMMDLGVPTAVFVAPPRTG